MEPPEAAEKPGTRPIVELCEEPGAGVEWHDFRSLTPVMGSLPCFVMKELIPHKLGGGEG